MNKLAVVNICIVLLHIFISVNLTSAKKGLRDSVSCRYSGGYDKKGVRCRADAVKPKRLPTECSAFIVDGYTMVMSLEIGFLNKIGDQMEKLIEKEDSSHEVYVLYRYENFDQFKSEFYVGNIQREANLLRTNYNFNPVKGLILDGISEPFTYQHDFDFYERFKTYITTIKTAIPGLEIGFYLSARTLIQNVDEGNSSTWFDFGKMNDFLDFYVIEFRTFNECTDDLLHGGITPMDSPNPAVMTLNKFADAFKQSTIDKEKVYFEFLIMPAVKRENSTQFPMHCEISYNEYCENYEKYKSIWCVDTQDMLVKKGQFAKTHSKGCIASDIDTVDRDEKCNCPDQYVTFFMMLDGYNGNENPMTCDKLK